MFPLHPYAFEHLEKAFVVSFSFSHICRLKQVSMAVKLRQGTCWPYSVLPSPRVTPWVLAGWGRPRPLPSLQLQQLTTDSKSTALGSGVLVVSWPVHFSKQRWLQPASRRGLGASATAQSRGTKSGIRDQWWQSLIPMQKGGRQRLGLETVTFSYHDTVFFLFPRLQQIHFF